MFKKVVLGIVLSVAGVSLASAAETQARPLVVGITEQFHQVNGHPLSSVGYEYVDALKKAGHIPVVVVRTGDTNRLARVLSMLDAVILTGGMDIDPALYRARRSPKCGVSNAERDAFDRSVLDYAVAHRLPVLGVCRGIQMINVYFGGTLWQDLPSEFPGVGRHQGKIGERVHEITLEPDSRLARVLGTTKVGLNSQHHQAVRDLAPGFRIVARAPDGVVEAIEGENLPIVGVQGHPEGLVWSDGDPVLLRLFRDLRSFAGAETWAD